MGTPQGAIVSPVLANVFLHYVLDLWFHKKWRPNVPDGEAIIVRYADDIVVGFQHKRDAERYLRDVRERLARFGLSLHQDKTRLVEFGRFADLNRRQRGVGKPETFDFLGLTHYCTTTLRGRFRLGRKPVAKRVNRTLARIDEVLRKRWHHDIWEVGRWLGRVCNGWLNYFAVPGTSGRFIRAFLRRLQRRWMRALRRRSQRARFSWKRLERMTEILWLRASIATHGRTSGLPSSTRGRSRMVQRPRPDAARNGGVRSNGIPTVVSINGFMFYEHLRGEGGGGAIDLVIHACRCTVPEALGFFSELPCRDRFPADRHPKPPCPDRHWPAIQSYLVEQRGLADVLVALCRDLGLLYADRHGNAVFVRRNAAGEALGAEIVPAAAPRRLAPTGAAARGGFWMSWEPDWPNSVILAKNAIDALSVLSLHLVPAGRKGCAVVSTGGATASLPEWIEAWNPGRIFCAYDATRQGDDAAARLIRNDSRVVRLRPALDGLDWNDMLMRDRAGEPLQIDDRPLD